MKLPYAFIKETLRIFAMSIVLIAIITTVFVLSVRHTGGARDGGDLQESIKQVPNEEIGKDSEENTKTPEAKDKKDENSYVELMWVSGYTSSPLETDEEPCISADGSNICQLFVSGENTCASNYFAFGTVLEVEDLGTCTIRDKMNKRFYYKIDWYFGFDREAALNFGNRQLKIRVIDKNNI